MNNNEQLDNGIVKNIAAILTGIIVIFCIGIFVLSGNQNKDEKIEISGSTQVKNNSSIASMEETSSLNTEQKTTAKGEETTENKTTEKEITTVNQTTVTQVTSVQASSVQASSVQPTSVQPSSSQPTSAQPTSAPEALEDKVERILSGLTLEEKVYQMFILAPEQLTGVSSVTQAGSTTKNAIQKYPVGGLIYFSNNIQNETQLTTMLAKTQEYSMERCGLKMFLCIDEEGGKVARIANNPSFNVEKFTDMASINTEAKAYHVGETIGAYLSKYGFNVDFAPDADVITEPQNTVIGTRSFGTDPTVVSKMALSVAKGLNSKGIMSTYKHFPGHGATVGDTHEGFSYTNKTEAELMQSELIPFLDAAQSGYVDMVMIAHISVPYIVGDNTPSSLSYKVVTEILKKKLGYKGLIVTDALNMGAIIKNYSSADAAVLAVKAGNDLLLMPEDFRKASQAVIQAVRNGEISEERINESVRKIIRAKLKL